MIRTEIALDRANVVRKFGLVVRHVSRRALRAFFLAHPRNKADGALRMDPQILHQMDRLHRDHHPCAVIDRSCSQIPGIQMARNHHHLLRMLGALPVGDHVVALRIRQRLRGQSQVQSSPAPGWRDSSKARHPLQSPPPPESWARPGVYRVMPVCGNRKSAPPTDRTSTATAPVPLPQWVLQPR